MDQSEIKNDLHNDEKENMKTWFFRDFIILGGKFTILTKNVNKSFAWINARNQGVKRYQKKQGKMILLMKATKSV